MKDGDKLLYTLLQIEETVDEFGETLKNIQHNYAENMKHRTQYLESYRADNTNNFDSRVTNVTTMGQDVLAVIDDHKARTSSKSHRYTLHTSILLLMLNLANQNV